MSDPSAPADDGWWAIVLAGGEGRPLRQLIREVFGDERPKQFAALVSDHSLLRQTLDRIERVVPSERVAIVSLETHAGYVARELGAGSAVHVLLQPEDRDTGIAVFLATYWIASRDPEAIVVIFPSDHFVLEDRAWLAHVGQVTAFVQHNPEWIVLLGVPATEPETEYGWIEPGAAVGMTSTGPIARIARFRERPSAPVAAACVARGWLWNTRVFVAKAPTLISVAEVVLPDVHRGFQGLQALFGTPHQERALRDAYARLPSCDFSTAVLETGLPFLAISTLPPLTWSDLGTPRRLFRLLRGLRVAPPWMRGRDREHLAHLRRHA